MVILQPHQRSKYPRMDYVAQYQAGQTEQNGVEQADPPTQIEAALAVVPPAHMEELFHGVAGDILYGRGEHHAHQKGGGGRVPAVAQGQQYQQGAVAINGAERAIEKASLLTEFSLADGTVYHFAAPAQEAVKQQKQEKYGSVIEKRKHEWSSKRAAGHPVTAAKYGRRRRLLAAGRPPLGSGR